LTWNWHSDWASPVCSFLNVYWSNGGQSADSGVGSAAIGDSPAARKFLVSKSSTSKRDEDSGDDSVFSASGAFVSAWGPPTSPASSASAGEMAVAVALRSSQAVASPLATGGPRSEGGDARTFVDCA